MSRKIARWVLYVRWMGGPFHQSRPWLQREKQIRTVHYIFSLKMWPHGAKCVVLRPRPTRGPVLSSHTSTHITSMDRASNVQCTLLYYIISKGEVTKITMHVQLSSFFFFLVNMYNCHSYASHIFWEKKGIPSKSFWIIR